MSDYDHLAAAKAMSGYSDQLAGSPDDRSVPYLLSGILDALVAIAERMPTPTTSGETAQREDDEA